MENKRKYALITGATSGIGKELAKLFAGDGYGLVIVGRYNKTLEQTAIDLQEDYEIPVYTIEKDLFLREGPFEVYEEVKSRGIHIDVLVNNAGQGEYGEFIETDINRELEIVQLNIGAYIILTKCFAKDMASGHGGKILNVGSIAGEVPGPLHSVYHGTKAFVNSWSEAVRNELKEHNITVTVLLPGATDTDFFHKAHMEDAKIVVEGKLADPAKVARDGYEALMSGDDKIVSGLKNKIQVAQSNIMPDAINAENMRKQQEPVDKKNDE